MITASNQLKTALDQDTTIFIKTGCTLEYNMNTLVDNITMTGAQISRTDSAGNSYQPFKKLFPIDSVIKPFRPVKAGIKYAIVGDIVANSYKDPRVSTYPYDYRTYLPGSETSYKYYVSDKNTGLDVTATYPKTILTNKIVIRFELAHSTPPTWAIYNGATQLVSGTSSDIAAFGTANSGTVTIHYNGTTWSKTEPTTYGAPVNMTSLRVTAGAVSGKYIGLIEMSPRWVKDITDRVINFSISKEASSNSEDILPVGSVTANSVSMQLASYEDIREVVSFDKTMTFDANKTYLYKRVIASPYFKIYHSAGTLTDSAGLYEKVNQGVFYLDSWSIGEFGDVSVNALDGAKQLQEIICPGIVCRGYTTIAILRTLLDNVGFTNYNFNTTSTDNSIFSPRFWWTDDSGTVWDSIQRLCRDSQMTALFDENNVLQFYTREYLFDSTKSSNWSFRYDASGSNLSNILSLQKNDLASANQVKVIWNSVTTNLFTGNSQPLWESGNAFMGAMSLEQNLLSIPGQTNGPYDVSGLNPRSYVNLKAVVAVEQSSNQILDEYTGYVAIDQEIIEYDAIQYAYVDLNGTRQEVDISTPSDALKYLGLSQAGAENFQPSGKYRIKTRGAFETKITDHYADAQGILDSWNGYEVTWVS
jgi:hypothetical protein